jgi:TrmH family RNA methyltransferase
LALSRAEAKNLKALSTKKGRRLAGQFVAEGVRLLEEAERHGIRPERVYVAPSIMSERSAALVARYRSSRVPLTELSGSDLARLAATEKSQGILAVFPIPAAKTGELDLTSRRNVLLCENISDPGNLGTLIRSALAFGFESVALAGECAEPYSPKVVRASAGAIFGVTIAQITAGQIVLQARKSGLALIAAGLKGAADIEQALREQFGQGVILAVGSEAEGLSDVVVAAADKVVRIGHSDRVESLNAAIAGSILMKACFDRRTQRTR